MAVCKIKELGGEQLNIAPNATKADFMATSRFMLGLETEGLTRNLML